MGIEANIQISLLTGWMDRWMDRQLVESSTIFGIILTDFVSICNRTKALEKERRAGHRPCLQLVFGKESSVIIAAAILLPLSSVRYQC